MIIINLKYFTDNKNNYILYQIAKQEPSCGYIVSKQLITRDCILPTNNTEQIESTLDTLTKDCIKTQMEKFSINSQDDFSLIKVLGNFIDLDSGNMVFQKGILDKDLIDKDNTAYRFGISIECHYPVTFKNFLKNPWLVFKSLFNFSTN